MLGPLAEGIGKWFTGGADVATTTTDAVTTTADATDAVTNGAVDGEKVGEIPKSSKGKGSVEPGGRDPQRYYTKGQKAEMLEKQGGNCPGCGEPKTLEEVEGHHLDRHADGGRTTVERGVSVCKGCHIKIHN